MPPARHSLSTSHLLLPIVVGALLATSAWPANASTFMVDRADDDSTASACTSVPNDCSLRGAISQANAAGDPDSIVFDPVFASSPVTVSLTLFESGALGPSALVIASDIDIEGPTSGGVSGVGGSGGGGVIPTPGGTDGRTGNGGPGSTGSFGAGGGGGGHGDTQGGAGGSGGFGGGGGGGGHRSGGGGAAVF